MRAALVLFIALCLSSAARAQDAVTRVFVFAGQSNMVGSDSRVEDVLSFPPFAGLEAPQPAVRFAYVLGREDKTRSDGWVELQPVNGVVGPELSFAREVQRHVDAPLAIIKVAAGGTHLGGDWNPDAPSGFEMYPLLLETVRASLAALDREGVRHRLEGFVWHQGENDMFDEGYLANYGANLANFVSSVRRDLGAPELCFYVGELCTKTVWGMDLRPRMHTISVAQKAVAAADPRVEYVPTSHIGVEIGQPDGLHYHYGTLGQLEHGVEHARAYLARTGVGPVARAPLATWPIAAGSKVRLFVLAGHRNMEGERAFVQELVDLPGGAALRELDTRVPFKYSIGGGVCTSSDWEPLGPAGLYDTFGPEVSFGATLSRELDTPFALAKFTHSGSQIIDWTPEGSVAVTRNLYPAFVAFVREAITELEARGHSVELAGVLYHVGENDMSFGPFRRAAATHVRALIEASRRDLGLPELRWFVSQQPPTEHAELNSIDVTAALAQLATKDPHCVHVQVFDLPPQAALLVLDTAGVVALGERLARAVLAVNRDLRHSSRAPAGAEQPLTLKDGDTVALVGNTFIEREQRDGYLELALTLAAPDSNVAVRNLGWSGDTVEARARRFFGSNPDGFQHLLDHVDLVRPTVVLVSYGASEAFDASQAADPGPARASFLAGYVRLLDALAERAPRIAIVTAPPLEAARSPAPELARRVNAELGWQAERLRELALERELRFVDLFSSLSQLLASDDSPGALTDNGVHLTPLGYQFVAGEVLAQLGLGAAPWETSQTRSRSPASLTPEIERLRAAIRAKNDVFFHRHRPQNETYLRGFRKSEQGRHATEIEAFGPLTLEHDRAVFALRAAAVRGEASR
jgi:lysophospholipase L1-like esterase